MISAVSILFAALLFAVEVPAGHVEIQMLDGTKVRGRVIVKTPSTIYLERADGEKVKVVARDIVAARSIAAPTPATRPATGPTPIPEPRVDLAAYQRQLRQMNPTTADQWDRFGVWCFAHGYPTQGQAAFDKSVALDPKNARARQERLADLLTESGRKYEAQAVLAALIRAHPDDQSLRDQFNKLTDALDTDVDDLVKRVKALYRAQAFMKVLQVLVPRVRGGHPVFLETLSVKIERQLGLPLDEMMVDCRLKLADKHPHIIRDATDYEKRLLGRHLETKADQAYNRIPSHVIRRLTDPRYRRYPYILRKDQRDQYIEYAEVAREQYAMLLQFYAQSDAQRRAAVQDKLKEIDKAIAALKKAKVR